MGQTHSSYFVIANWVEDLALVGGLGDSPYLRSKLRAWCNLRGVRLRTMEDRYDRYRISVMAVLMLKSWGAVAKGAVAYGLGAAKVTKRLIQSHYGIGCAKPFQLLDDDVADIWLYRGTQYCRNCVDWIVPMVC